MKTYRLPGLEHIFLFFIDGLGLGNENANINPCLFSGSKYFTYTRSNHYPLADKKNQALVFDLDASLKIAGLPQSATGQTALFTGINAAKELGRHLCGFPNKKLRQIIKHYSILKRLSQLGYKAGFLNTFQPRFFDFDPHEIVHRLSVTSCANLYADLPFFNLNDLRNGLSVYHDITNEKLRYRGFDVPMFSIEQAGEIVARQIQQYNFLIYEFFQTDQIGHAQNLEHANNILKKLDTFLNVILKYSNMENTLIIITSDHGNIEDLSVKTHTLSPAMTILFGDHRFAAQDHLFSIQDITPWILSFAK